MPPLSGLLRLEISLWDFIIFANSELVLPDLEVLVVDVEAARRSSPKFDSRRLNATYRFLTRQKTHSGAKMDAQILRCLSITNLKLPTEHDEGNNATPFSPPEEYRQFVPWRV